MSFRRTAIISYFFDLITFGFILFCTKGYGTHFYTETEYYEGEWYADKRSGWGRMYYADGSIYEGEWYDDQRNGQGMLRLRELFEQVILESD